eukprot:gene23-22_t
MNWSQTVPPSCSEELLLEANSTNEFRLSEEKKKLRTEIEALLKKELVIEEKRQKRVMELNDKMMIARHKVLLSDSMDLRLHLNHMDDDHGVQAARETKFHHFEEREASRRSQIRRVREEREARKAMLDKEADHIQFDIVRHQIRRNEIYQQRAEETTSKFEQKQKHFEELEQQREKNLADEKERIKNRNATRKQRVLSTGAQLEAEFRRRSEEELKQAMEISKLVLDREFQGLSDRIKERKIREKLYNFRVKEKRRLQELNLEADRQLIQVRQTKLDQMQSIRDKIGNKRTQLLNQIFRERNTRQEAPPLETSPGPGSYDIEISKSVRGGLITKSSPQSGREWEHQYSPGPGDYDVRETLIRPGSGVTPFRERGVCDWQRLTAVPTPDCVIPLPLVGVSGVQLASEGSPSLSRPSSSSLVSSSRISVSDFIKLKGGRGLVSSHSSSRLSTNASS